METIRFGERKKSSYKLQVFLITFFICVGGLVTYYAICNEEEPIIIGDKNPDIKASVKIAEDFNQTDALENIEDESLDKDVDNLELSKLYAVSNKSILDKTNKKIKANITLPVITINNEVLTDINEEIYNKFNDAYNSFKEVMQKVENNFTYTVTYKVYDCRSNSLENNKDGKTNILSLTIYERIIDDNKKIESMEKIHAYNIDLDTSKILEQEGISLNILGSDYKDKITNTLKDYCIKEKMVDENDFLYSYTGLEKYYVKDGVLHLLFDPGEIVDKKYGILNIAV